MKCKDYAKDDDRPGGCTWQEDQDCPFGDDQYSCRHGWLPCWTEAERAGLKAMGNEHKLNRNFGTHKEEMASYWAIFVYVHASRRVKEGK